MKLTKSKLIEIINEELEKVLEKNQITENFSLDSKVEEIANILTKNLEDK